MRWFFAVFLILIIVFASGCSLLESPAEDDGTGLQSKIECSYECCPAAGDAVEKRCFYEEQVCRGNSCKWATPVDLLNDLLIAELSINCESSNKGEIADCILWWQDSRMTYCYKNPQESGSAETGEGYDDCSEPLQLNEMVAGSFPASKMLERRKEGKPYGTSLEFAVTYCALARFYGLKCRVMASKSNLTFEEISGDYGIGHCGIVRKSLLIQLDEQCEEWEDISWKAGPKHYWAEVFLDKTWILREANQAAYNGGTENVFRKTADYYDTGW